LQIFSLYFLLGAQNLNHAISVPVTTATYYITIRHRKNKITFAP